MLDATGKVVATHTVYPFQPRNDLAGAQVTLAQAIATQGVKLTAIGNGTASREPRDGADGWDLLAHLPGSEKPVEVIVSEAGASVYSASELAAKEFPDLGVSLCAVSIARRLQDPLAELVKTEPKSIGGGQDQHDEDPGRLGRSLEAMVEDAVNALGVDLNTASAPLLARVSGLGLSLAGAIVAHRHLRGGRERDQGPQAGDAAERDRDQRRGPRAFVDVGVHQDGLVHVSQFADRFVRGPLEVVKAGDVVQVRVVEVDAPRKRIGLTMRKDSGEARERVQAPTKALVRGPASAGPNSGAPGGNALADALKGKFGR